MGRDLSFEDPSQIFFATIRTNRSRLWFVNNFALQMSILAYLARYQERYAVQIFAFVIMGNHYHLLARFPRGNKAAFFRDLNGMISKLTASKVRQFDGGKLWGGRIRCQVVPNPADVVDKFFYIALNPVAAGIVQKLSDYTLYNSFADAAYQRRKTFRVVDWPTYNSRKRFDPNTSKSDCTTVHTLTFSKLPKFEHLSRKDYADRLNHELEARRKVVVDGRLKGGKKFASREAIRAIEPGSLPHSTKTSQRHTPRPLVLTSCPETKRIFLDWYFTLRAAYITASRKLRSGQLTVTFPPGTYRPSSYSAHPA